MQEKIMKSKNLENKIINKIYNIEKKSTLFVILRYFFFLVLFLSLVIFFSTSSISILKEQQTLDLLELFNENIEVIQTYFSEVVFTFFEELPKLFVFSSVLFTMFLAITLFFLTRNYKKLKNKISSIRKYRTETI